MVAILTKGTGNQVRNRDRAIEIALRIYENSFKTENNNNDISIDGKIFRVAAYADPKSKYALLNTVEAIKNKELPQWYTEEKAGIIITKQMTDGRLIFFAVEKEILLHTLKTNSHDGVSVDWVTINRIKNKALTKIYVPPK